MTGHEERQERHRIHAWRRALLWLYFARRGASRMCFAVAMFGNFLSILVAPAFILCGVNAGDYFAVHGVFLAAFMKAFAVASIGTSAKHHWRAGRWLDSRFSQTREARERGDSWNATTSN